MLARFGSARHDKIHNVNACPTEPYQTKLDQASPLDTTGPARYGMVFIELAHHNIYLKLAPNGYRKLESGRNV